MPTGTAVLTGQSILATKMNLKLEGFPVGGGIFAQIAASSTRYQAPFQDGVTAVSESIVQWPAPFAGTLKNLYVRTGGAQPGTGSLVFTVRKNGADTGVTVTIAAGGAAQTGSDTANSVAVAVGDLIDLKVVNNASGASATIAAWGLDFVGGYVATSRSTGDVQPTAVAMNAKLESIAFGLSTFTGIFAGQTVYAGLFFSSVSGTETSVQWPAPFAGTIRNLYVRTSGAQPGTGTQVVTVRKNGVDQALTLTIGAGAATGTFSDVTHSFTVAAGDLISIKFVNNAATNAARISGTGLEFVGGEVGTAVATGQVISAATFNGKIEGFSLGGGQIGTTVGANTTTYCGPYPRDFNSTEANVEWPCPYAGTLRNLRVCIATAQPSGSRLQVAVFVNGVIAGTLLVQIQGTDPVGIYSNTSDSIAVAAGDRISFQFNNNHPSLASAAVAGFSLDLVG